MTAADLDALERLLAEATPGPWKTEHQRSDSVDKLADAMAVSIRKGGVDWHWLETQPYSGTWPAATGNGPTSEANAALIAAAVNALPELIAAARERDAMQKDRDAELTAVEELMNTLREVRRERDALRAEVERMRAVVEAAREIDSACDRDEPRYVPCRDSSGSGALCRACRVDVALAAALAALDGKDSAK